MLLAREAQMQSCLRVSAPWVDLLFDFHAPLPKDGMRRFVV